MNWKQLSCEICASPMRKAVLPPLHMWSPWQFMVKIVRNPQGHINQDRTLKHQIKGIVSQLWFFITDDIWCQGNDFTPLIGRFFGETRWDKWLGPDKRINHKKMKSENFPQIRAQNRMKNSLPKKQHSSNPDAPCMVYLPTWLGYIDGKCYHIYHLVGGLNPSEKYESQLGWWDSQYFWENKKWQPVTTNQPYMDPMGNGCWPAESIRCHTVASPLKILGEISGGSPQMRGHPKRLGFPGALGSKNHHHVELESSINWNNVNN